MQTTPSLMTISLACLCLTVLGCGSDHDLTPLQAELALAVSRYESAEANFGPSTNYDELIKNGHWLDRMAEEIQAVERIETQAVSLGAQPIPEVRQELAQRFRRLLSALQSDIESLDIKRQFEITEMWIDVARGGDH